MEGFSVVPPHSSVPPVKPPSPLASSSSRKPWRPSPLSLGLGLAAGATIALASVSPSLRARLPPLAALAASLSSVSSSPSLFASMSLSATEFRPSSVVEPSSGASFPLALFLDSDDGASEERMPQQLVGLGLRKKSILGLKKITVYAFGIYADEASLRDTLGNKYLDLSPLDLRGRKEFYDDVISNDSNLTVRLVIVYGHLKIGSVRSAFEESIGNRIKKFSGTENKELLQSFTSQFKDDYKLPHGTTIDLTRRPGHFLQTKIDGKEIGCVQNPLLCRSLFDLYLGDEAFDLKAKEEMGMGLASLLKG